jgi:hypothetical protein
MALRSQFNNEPEDDFLNTDSDSSPHQSAGKELATTLIRQSHTLLSELTTVQSHLAALKKPSLVELRQFKSAIQSELQSLEKLSEKASNVLSADVRYGADSRNDNSGNSEAEDARILHSLRSSNLPFYYAVWKVAKRSCTGIVAFRKRFYWQEPSVQRTRIDGTGQALILPNKGLESSLQGLEVRKGEPGNEASRTHKRSVHVDIVADNGEEWVKVSTITPNRLLFELAKRGWERDWPSPEEDGDEQGQWGWSGNDKSHGYQMEESRDLIEVVRLAADMKKAAAAVRIRYKHPRIRFVLPNVVEGQISEIDDIIDDIRKIGIMVQCGTAAEDLSGSLTLIDGASTSENPEVLEQFIPALLPNPYPHLTSTLNVDCTLLLALVSDLSHFRGIHQSPTHHRAIVRQIELEAEQPLVPSELWPVMGDKDLVCTEEAVNRMREIVDTIGTESEKARTKLLMGGVGTDTDREILILRFQKLSDHKVPMDWKIPIRVIDAHAVIQKGWENGQLPSLARKVANHLSDLNQSVFLYGWASGLMTISSNRAVTKQIELLVEENRNGNDDTTGPLVWVCNTARSLIGKESNKKL